MQQRVPYNESHQGIKCSNQNVMNLTYKYDRGYVWRFHKSRFLALYQSLFCERKSELQIQFLVIYLWFCCCASRTTIHFILGVDLDTVNGITQDFFSGDQNDDFKIGKCNIN